jgi:outer membrane protein
MGQADARDLGLDGGPLYDPLGNYRRVAGSWNDWANDPRHIPVATRTVDAAEMPPAPIVLPPLLSSNKSPPPPSQTGIDPAAANLPDPLTTGVTPPR